MDQQKEHGTMDVQTCKHLTTKQEMRNAQRPSLNPRHEGLVSIDQPGMGYRPTVWVQSPAPHLFELGFGVNGQGMPIVTEVL